MKEYINILAIDPGSSESAWVNYGLYTGTPLSFGKVPNEQLLEMIQDEAEIRENGTGNYAPFGHFGRVSDHLVVEMIASYGMPVGREVFETVFWLGRFCEAWRGSFDRVYRRNIKLHLCGVTKAKDSNVRQAILDRYGGKDVAIGKKGKYGPLHGVTKDIWAALGVAIYYAETKGK